MKRKQIQRMIPLYIRGELSTSQLEEFQALIRTFHECRKELENYTFAYNKSRLHNITQERVDITDIVIEKIQNEKELKPEKHTTHWTRLAIAATFAAIVLVLALVQPWKVAISPQSIIAYASSPQLEIKSYRMVYSSINTNELGTYTTQAQAIYVAPDKFSLEISVGDWLRKYITIGETVYSFEIGTPVDITGQTIFFSSYIPHKEATLGILEQLVDFQKLDDEKVDGISCYKLEGRYPEPALEEMLPQGQLSDEEYKTIISLYGQKKTTNKAYLWIDKDTYVIKKMSLEITDQDDNIIHSETVTYYDFNQDFTIDPPLDSPGVLSPGWKEIER